MQLQPQEKPQPIKISLDAPTEKVNNLARYLYSDQDTRHQFENAPVDLLRAFGLELNNVVYEMGKKKKKDDPADGDLGDSTAQNAEVQPSDQEAVVVCAAVVSDVVVGAVVCAVAI